MSEEDWFRAELSQVSQIFLTIPFNPDLCLQACRARRMEDESLAFAAVSLSGPVPRSLFGLYVLAKIATRDEGRIRLDLHYLGHAMNII